MSRTTSKIYIFGAGGQGCVCADIFHTNKTRITGFFDDVKPKSKDNLIVLGTIDDLISTLNSQSSEYFVGIGDNRTREKITKYILSKTDKKPINCVSRFSILSETVRLGYGVFISAGAVINTGTIIGNGVIINTNSTIDHDCILSDFTAIQPGAILGGSVNVSPLAMIGMGAAVKQGVYIGKNAIVGGGAMVIGNVNPGSFVVGVPAREVEKK